MKYEIKTLIRNIVNEHKIFLGLYERISSIKTALSRNIDDEKFFKKRYKENTGEILNIDNPRTFNEKLIWLQLHDHNPLYTILTDKYLVKQWVASKIGTEHVVPLLGVWDNVDDIPFNTLPDECVLKCNHDSGSVYIKHYGVPFNIKEIKKKFRKALKFNYYYVGRVWGYKNIIPKVFCEEFIKSSDSDIPRDYKIFCFDGEPKFLFVASDRGKGTKFDFFDIEWNRIPVKQHYPNSNYDIKKPKNWNEMLNIAKILSANISHVRVDLYIDANDKIYFGEMTFCHFSGKEKFEPAIYDEIFGSYLKINTEE